MVKKMNCEAMKKSAALAVLDYIQSGDVLGIGTGSTVNHFITALQAVRGKVEGVVASSEATAKLLREVGLRLLSLNEAGTLRLYVDGADEVSRNLHLIKGGGGALTREKVVASVSTQFVCIANSSKLVARLGAFPLPVEVLPMAQSAVARKVATLGGLPMKREGFISDNGNIILDVKNLDLSDAVAMETRLNNITGVVANGIFAHRPADVLLLGGADGVECIKC